MVHPQQGNEVAGEVKTQGRLVRFKTGMTGGLFGGLEVSIRGVPEKSAMGLPSKQRIVMKPRKADLTRSPREASANLLYGTLRRPTER